MSDNQLPILGVHIGELGFLNQATKINYIKIIDDIVSKDKVSFQEHFLLDATIFKDKTDIYTFKSLNDFAINQITYSRLLQIDVKVNNMKDGLIMYCTEREDGYGDFASIAIKSGFFEFKFDTGSGTYI